jgi:uncharacterized RDD family membrane protein YckC
LTILLGLSADPTSAIREGAGFWIRALARSIDTLVHFLIGAAAAIAAGVLIAIGSAIQGTSPDAAMEKLAGPGPLGLAASLVGSIAMHTLSEWLHGSTLGKRICGLTVVSEHGGFANGVSAFKRSVAFFWDSLFFGVVAANKMAESQARRRYGDIWGHTQVVRLSSLDARERRSWMRFAGVTIAALFADGLVLFVELATRLL